MNTTSSFKCPKCNTYSIHPVLSPDDNKTLYWLCHVCGNEAKQAVGRSIYEMVRTEMLLNSDVIELIAQLSNGTTSISSVNVFGDVIRMVVETTATIYEEHLAAKKAFLE